jgi:hypothetical protein
MVDTSSAGNGSAVAITSKNKWSLDQTAATIEVTAFEDTSKSYVVDLPDAKGDLSGFWDSADNAIYNVLGSSVARKFYLYPDVSNNVGTYFFCTAFFSGKSDGATGTAVNFSLSWSAATPGAWVHP